MASSSSLSISQKSTDSTVALPSIPCIAPFSGISRPEVTTPVVETLAKLREVLNGASKFIPDSAGEGDFDCIAAAFLKRLYTVVSAEIFQNRELITNILGDPDLEKETKVGAISKLNGEAIFVDTSSANPALERYRAESMNFADELKSWSDQIVPLIGNPGRPFPQARIWRNIEDLLLCQDSKIISDTSLSPRAICGEVLIDYSGLQREVAVDYDLAREHIEQLHELEGNSIIMMTFIPPPKLSEGCSAMVKYLTDKI